MIATFVQNDLPGIDPYQLVSKSGCGNALGVELPSGNVYLSQTHQLVGFDLGISVLRRGICDG